MQCQAVTYRMDERSKEAAQELISIYFEAYIQPNLNYLIESMGYFNLKTIIDDLLLNSSSIKTPIKKYDMTSDDEVVLSIFDRLINGRLENIEPLMANLKKLNSKPTLEYYNHMIAKMMCDLFKGHMVQASPEVACDDRDKKSSSVARCLFPSHSPEEATDDKEKDGLSVVRCLFP